MADSPIGSLIAAQQIENADLFVLEQSGVAKKLSGALLTEFINRNIVNVEVRELEAGNPLDYDYDSITGRLRIWIPRGNSVVNISKDANGLITYLLADGTTFQC